MHKYYEREECATLVDSWEHQNQQMCLNTNCAGVASDYYRNQALTMTLLVFLLAALQFALFATSYYLSNRYAGNKELNQTLEKMLIILLLAAIIAGLLFNYYRDTHPNYDVHPLFNTLPARPRRTVPDPTLQNRRPQACPDLPPHLRRQLQVPDEGDPGEDRVEAGLRV